MSTAIIGIILVCILVVVGYFILNPGEEKDEEKPTHKDDKDDSTVTEDDSTVTDPTYSYDGHNIHNIRSP